MGNTLNTSNLNNAPPQAPQPGSPVSSNAPPVTPPPPVKAPTPVNSAPPVVSKPPPLPTPPSTSVPTPGTGAESLKGEEYITNELNPEDLDTSWNRWKCLVCNYVYEGRKPLKKCPKCGNEDPDKFQDAD